MIENIINIQKQLKKNGIKLWLMYNHSSEDKYFSKYISSSASSSSYCLISPKACYILVHELDKDNIAKEANDCSENVHILSFSNSKELIDRLEDILDELKFINEIALSYSTMTDPNVDILGHGLYVDLTKLIRKIYVKCNKKVKFKSAEKIMYALSSQKTDKQIERLKFIANLTQYILEQTFENIKVGMSEIEINKLTRDITEEIMSHYIDSNEIVSYKLAWDDCPIVLTGVNLAKGGHSLPSDKKLIEGDTIYFDFGITVNFDDGEKLSTDMQRMGYALKEKETNPPKQVQKVFDVLVDSIENGMDEMKPFVKAYEIDNIVRGEILKAGYPNYNHATGHPVGELVHDVGAIITTSTSKLSNLELVKNAVYTLEPRVNIANGGSIEEMVLVTNYGGIPLCKPQKKLYII